MTTGAPSRNFTLTTEERIRALTIGPPAYALRKRHIEDLELDYANAIVAVHDAVAAKAAKEGVPVDPEAQDQAMKAKAASIDLRKLNALVANHNRYFPIEANLPMDRDGYLYLGKRWLPEDPFTAGRLLTAARAIIAARG
ncbi:MAG: hypothetical protein JST00_13020 [Deltaproteobacteria bacterium]|nr:hypothetical protein [Deltaproteobacteria bacterium]